MRLLTISVLFALSFLRHAVHGTTTGLIGSIFNIFGSHDKEKNPCDQDAFPLFIDAIDDFTVRLTKRAAFYANNGNFVVSPFSIWLSLASVAEYSDERYILEFFKALNLPEEKCLRDQFYKFASTLEISGDSVFLRNRAFDIDKLSRPNKEWLLFNWQFNLLNYVPVFFDQVTFDYIRSNMGIFQPLPYYGNAILLDSLYYEGFWTTAFSQGITDIAPFYNDLGQPIGSVDYLIMKDRVRLAHVSFLDAKVLELPVGSDGKYTMLLTMGVRSNSVRTILELWKSSVVADILESLTLSLAPIEVAIPRFFMRHGFNAKPALEDLGFSQLFADRLAAKYIADPPPVPSYFFQRVDVNITSGYFQSRYRGGNLPIGYFDQRASDLASVIGRDFIANRPFFFALVERKTGATIFTGLYAYPEQPIVPVQTWSSQADINLVNPVNMENSANVNVENQVNVEKRVNVEHRVNVESQVNVENSVNVVNPVETVDSVSVVNPVDTVDPVNVVNPVDTVDPVNVVSPVDTADPVNVVSPVDTVDPVNVVNPVGTADLVNVVNPVGTVNSVNVVNPVDTVDLVNVVNPIDTVDPVNVVLN